MKAAIVTVGTEITDGQITDRNSQWLSERLTALGLEIVAHVSVPDSADAMSAAFQWSLSRSDLLVICGGLGPTSDDFTRDVVADYFQQPLVLDSDSWNYIQKKLSSRNVTLREGHRRQAMIPKNAKALENDAGVAPGFALAIGPRTIWVLPGPPKEIEAIWKRFLEPQIQAWNIQQTSVLHTWRCQGVPESELAHMTEEFFSVYDFDKKFGYRAHAPYVEIKLWVQKSDAQAVAAVAAFTEKIKPFLFKD